MLYASCHPRRETVHRPIDERTPELWAGEAAQEVGILPLKEFVAHDHAADTLPSVAEGFGAGDEHNPVISILRNAGLVGRYARVREVFSEVHGEVCQVFDEGNVVLLREAR